MSNNPEEFTDRANNRRDRRSREWCCYLNDTELAQRLNIGTEKLSILRAEPGFPPRDHVTNKRFWPAVEAWLLHRHGLAEHSPEAPDGQENWS